MAAYSTATQVKDKDLTRLVSQAGWVDADVDDRIAEGDALIQVCLADIGYTLSLISSATPIVNRLSILYGRYACLRDIYQNFAPSQSGGDGFKHMLDQFNAILQKLKDGAPIVDASGVEIPVIATGSRVQISSDSVRRALDMGDPESQTIDADYNADDLIGNPSE